MSDASLGHATLRTRLDNSGLRTGLEQAKTETQRAAGDIVRTLRGAFSGAVAAFASSGIAQFNTFLQQSAQIAHQAESSHRLFERQLARNNESLARGRQLVQQLSDRFGVANSVIEESATLLLRAGGSLDDVERALTAAGATGAAAGIDLERAFSNMAIAVATGRSTLLDTIGVVTNLGPATQEYANSIGKTVESLTQAELIQARVNAIYEETASEIEDVDTILEGLPLSQARVNQQWRIFRENVGEVAQEIIIPLNRGLESTLGIINSMHPELTRFGVAFVGLTLGVSGLSAAFQALRIALPLLRAAFLPLLGPGGLIAAGAILVGSLAFAFAGRSDSLDKAVQNASDALASGDKTSFLSALDAVIEKSSGEMKTSLSDLRDELVATGDVAVEQAERILFALARSRLQLPQPGPLGLRTEGSPLREGLMVAETFGVTNALDRTIAALEQGDRIAAMLVLAQAGQVLAEAATRGQAQLPWVEAVQALWDEIATIPQRAAEMVEDFKPPPIEPPPGLGISTDGSTSEAEAVVSDPAAAARRWVERLEAELRFGLKGPREVIDLLSPRVEELREEAANALAEFGIDSEAYRDTVAKLDVVEDFLQRVIRMDPTLQVGLDTSRAENDLKVLQQRFSGDAGLLFTIQVVERTEGKFTSVEDAMRKLARAGVVITAPMLELLIERFGEMEAAADRAKAAIDELKQAELERLRDIQTQRFSGDNAILFTVQAVERTAGAFTSVEDAIRKLARAGVVITGPMLEYLIERFGEMEAAADRAKAAIDELRQAELERLRDIQTQRFSGEAAVAFTVQVVERTEGKFTSVEDAMRKLAHAGVVITGPMLEYLIERFEQTSEAADRAKAAIDELRQAELERLRDIQTQRFSGDAGLLFTIQVVERTEGKFTSVEDAIRKLAEVGVVITGPMLEYLIERFEQTGEAADRAKAAIDEFRQAELERLRDIQTQRFSGDNAILFTVQAVERTAGAFQSVEDAMRKLAEAGVVITAPMLEYLIDRFEEMEAAADRAKAAIDEFRQAELERLRDIQTSRFSGDNAILFTVQAVERTEGEFTSVEDAIRKLADAGVVITGPMLEYLIERFEGPIEDAGINFAEAVISAGQGFVSAIEEFQAGDVGGGIAGLGSAVGGLFSAFGQLEGPISALGPWGALISAGAGLLGGIISLFQGDGGRREQEQQRRVGNVPAIELHFTVNQTNNYQGGPSQPENEQAFRRQATILWEELYRRNLGPRLDRIEQRLGIAGAGA